MARAYQAGWFVLVMLSVTAGCGGGAYPEVEGVITLNGKPLGNVQVQFLPDPEQDTRGPRSTGVSDKDGRFRLTTDDKRPGAVPGKHRVLVEDLQQWDGIRMGRADSNKPLKPSRLPGRYSDAAKTPLKVEVKSGGEPVKLELTNP